MKFEQYRIAEGIKTSISKLGYKSPTDIQFKPKWQTFLQAKNLLNDDSVVPSGNSSHSEGIPIRGREILGGIVWWL